jgi:hypothetical protein
MAQVIMAQVVIAQGDVATDYGDSGLPTFPIGEPDRRTDVAPA